jgi:hypothetical protein
MSHVVCHTGFPGDPPDPGDAAYAIERLAARRADALCCALVLAPGVLLAVLISSPLIAPLAAGAVAAGAIAGAAHLALLELLDHCALFATTSRLPAVAARQERLTDPRRRRALAADLRAMVEQRSHVQSPARPLAVELALPERIRARRLDLLELADLVEQTEQPDPVAVARTAWLLHDALHSPLHNPAIPAEALADAIHHARLRFILARRDE